jgi:hypothetical protein
MADMSSLLHASPHLSPYCNGRPMNHVAHRRRIASSGAAISSSASSKNASPDGDGRGVGVTRIETLDRHGAQNARSGAIWRAPDGRSGAI